MCWKGWNHVVPNKKNNLILMSLVTSWYVCMDYRELNSWTEKDQFLMPFMDQILGRLASRGWYCFLDKYTSYHHISIMLEDYEKATFTCPYGYIFWQGLDYYVDVHGWLLVVSDSFDDWLEHLANQLRRCEECKLVLNWEKCHYMIK